MSHSTQQTEGICILVVEDSVTQAEGIRYFLEEHHYRVHLCHDGQEALEWLQGTNTLPDMVISDIIMPRMDGYELCKAVRSDARLNTLPFILLTSLSRPEEIIKSIEAGANKFLTKPFDHKRLPDMVNELHINTRRRGVEQMGEEIKLVFGGKEFLITADKVQILDLLLSSYEETYYQTQNLMHARSELERLNAELERKVQERTRQLKLQREQFRTLAEHSPDMIVRVDKNLNLAYANSAVGALFGVPATELIGQPISRLEEAIGSCPCTFIVNHLFKSGEEMRLEYDFQTLEGTKWIDSTFVPEFDEQGRIEYALKVARDVTPQKEAEKLLYQKEQAIDSSINGIGMADLEGRMTYANDAFLKIWGFKKEEEVIGRSVQVFWEDAVAASEVLETIQKQGKWVGQFKGKRDDGSSFEAQSVVHSVKDPHGKVVSYMAFFTDISESKRIEAELEEKERLVLMQSKQAAMGEMIAMIAHQWRQPITVISMVINNLNADVQLGEKITNEELEKLIGTVSDQTQYLSKTIEDFRDFFKPTKDRVTTTIGTIIENAMKIIGKSLEASHIAVEIDNRTETELLLYDNELIQVFLNLFNNAKDVILERRRENGKIRVTIKEFDGVVRVMICDNGGGIPEEVIHRLGEPYFSTKEKNATGLGLYMSKMIVEKHLGGTLSWHNSDVGACFEIMLKSGALNPVTIQGNAE